MSILSEAPAGANVLDLGAARVARAEARAAAGLANPYIKLAAGFVEVRAEFDIGVALDFQAEDIKGGLTKLLVDPADVDALINDGLSAADLTAITEFVTGSTLGESSASSTL
ncbi:MAG: hypothetical protein H7288_11430 [Kineosporiaceae bacterium]|nr:hypothetical protein [Aeromicrobium sp.]